MALTVAAIAVAGSPTDHPRRRPVIVVADVGVDDAAALLLVLASPEVELLGVAASLGCHRDAKVTARNAARLMKAAGRSDVPVFTGARWPFGSNAPLDRDGSHFHGAEGFGAEIVAAETLPSMATDRSAAEFIASTARARPGEVTLLCFSPLTDVALAVSLEPSLPSLLRALVAMGGVVHRRGNVSPLAEANFAHDAAAARAVITAWGQPRGRGVPPPVLALLDVTEADDARTTGDDVRTIEASGGAAARMFAAAWRSNYAAACVRCHSLLRRAAWTLARRRL